MRLALWISVLLAVGTVASCGDGSVGGSTRTTSETTSPGATRKVAQTLELEGTATLYGADPADNAGAVTSGDFNADGLVDVAFAAAFADGPQNERLDAGEAYIFLGPLKPGETRDAAAGDQQLTVYGADPGDQLGRAIAAGDFDGDGADDLVLGAPFGDGPAEDRADSGEVQIIYGSTELGDQARTIDLATQPESIVYGSTAGDLTGFALTTANLNGDGARDILIGAFGASPPAGERVTAGAVYAVFGDKQRPDAVDTAAGAQDITVFGAEAGDRLGETVAAGDVSGDGFDDLILPAPFASGATGVALAGRTYIINSPSPATIDLSTDSVNSTIYGVDDGDQLGHAAASADVDGDGLGDVFLTAVSADGPGNEVDLAGEAALVFGSKLKPQVDVASGGADVLIYGADQLDRLGRSAATGDIDGDGRADLLIGAPGGAGRDESAPATGELYVLLAGDLPKSVQLPPRALVHFGSAAGDSLASEVFGSPPLAVARLNEGLRAEIVVAAPAADGPQDSRADCGEVYVLFPSTQ